MKSIYHKIKINNYTYLFMLLCLLCGYIKNIFLIFSLCLIHELGHIFFIKLFQYEVIKIEILPFGGYTEINKKINSNINEDLLIACGGILIQIIFGIVIYFFKGFFSPFTYHLLTTYNFILIIFNLIPIIPLDGNQIIHLLLEKYFSYSLSYRLNLVISLCFFALFTYFNYITAYDNYFILTFLLYKIIMAYKNYPYYHYRFLLERYLDDFSYQKIDNKTKNIKELRKNVLHFFKEDNHYIKENKKIKEFFWKGN